MGSDEDLSNGNSLSVTYPSRKWEGNSASSSNETEILPSTQLIGGVAGTNQASEMEFFVKLTI